MRARLGPIFVVEGVWVLLHRCDAGLMALDRLPDVVGHCKKTGKALQMRGANYWCGSGASFA